MTYSTKTFYKLKIGIIALFILSIILTSCATQVNKKYIPPLTQIDYNPKNHYLKTSQLSKDPIEENSKMDEIVFPKTANVLLTRIISPDYLTKAEIKEFIFDLSPPANSSLQTRAELDFLLELQSTRTEEEISEALKMHDIVYFPVFGMQNENHLFYELFELLGKDFEPKNYPKTKKLFHNIMKEMRVAEFTIKNHFLRARPRQLESSLTPLKKMNSSSFTSGHTLWAYMQAYLFAELIPNRRDDLLKIAYELGYSREILGVHYPSDEEISRKLAHTILTKMWDKPNFQHDFDAALKEWNNK